jgi:hypothetical protein
VFPRSAVAAAIGGDLALREVEQFAEELTKALAERARFRARDVEQPAFAIRVDEGGRPPCTPERGDEVETR